MPALGYKARFADLVASGAKSHTIRRPRVHPLKPGDILQHYTGMRTKACRRLREPTVCTAVTGITIFAKHKVVILAPGSKRYPVDVSRALDNDTVNALAKADGFADAAEFFAWFGEQHGPTFEGFLIEWGEPERESFFTPETRARATAALNTMCAIAARR